ncbi:metalloprotease [Haemophilus influenzae]|uniref:Metalloprotease n=1 Tax=Haemophilus influenzae TaxID=727 RepID=A0A2X1PP76_HAEIF|nr:metalloprotease [Haemophilus influenzae]
MQHVKLARDRRKKRAYIKVGVFFIAILLILTGILLTIKDKSEGNPIFSTSDSGEYHELNTSPNENSTALQSDENATSYDDELQAKDDEVDEVKLSSDDLDTLPQHAQDALNGLLDAADQAIRITNQFSYTVTEGDRLKDVLVLSGLDDSSVQPLIALDPELAHLKAGQQFYWILDKNDNLEYLNWLVSEKEERIYERLEDGKFKRQVIQKKSIWRKEVLKGEIQNSLNSSLREKGLDTRQIKPT